MSHAPAPIRPMGLAALLAVASLAGGCGSTATTAPPPAGPPSPVRAWQTTNMTTSLATANALAGFGTDL